MYKVLKLVTFVHIILNILSARHPLMAQENSIFLYNRIENCKNNEYFDVNYLKCKLCDINLNLIPANDYLSCRCKDETITLIKYENLSTQPICAPQNQTVSSAQTVKCSKIKYINQTNLNIQQKSYHIYETDAQNCTCNLTNNVLSQNQYCLPKIFLKDFINYNSFRTNDVYKDLAAITFFCQQMKDTTFCNYLANLCVLSDYNLDKNSPCSVFFTTQTSIISNNGGNDKITPFLFLKKGKDTVDELDKIIDQEYSLNEMDKKNKIQLILIGYNLTGHLKTYQSFKMSDLNLCTESLHKYRTIIFGQSFTSQCKININQYLSSDFEHKTTFYDFYLNYTENNISLMKSIPILIRDLFSYNSQNNRDKWQLVKRFSILDTQSEPNKMFKSKLYNKQNMIEKYRIIKYLKNVEILFNLNGDHDKNGNKIAIPILILDYGEINTNNYNSSSVHNSYETGSMADSLFVEFTFKITFAKRYRFDSMLDIILSIFLIVGFLTALFQTVRYKVRQQRQYFDLDIFRKFIIFLCSNVANALFGCVAFLTVYIFIVYKSQKTVKILLPVERQQDMIEIFIYVAVGLKSIKLLQFIWQICNIDIFLIDWERPKIYDNHLTNMKSNLDTSSISSYSKNVSYDGVSAWRNFFISNEWLKLATKRKFSNMFQIVSLLFIFIIFDYENLASTNFKLSPKNDNQVHTIDLTLKIANGILIYTLLYAIQRIFNVIVKERYVKNEFQQFVDICSIANISVFILLYDSFGFYIHGRSPHGFSDTDMCSMILQLKREEESACGYRGLLSGSKQQTFSFLAPRNLRLLYDKLNKLPFAAGLSPSNFDFGNPKYYEQSLERTASSYYNLNRFLSAFIDHGLKDLEYVMQDKTLMEVLLDFEYGPNLTENQGIFYVDSGHSFDRVLFYGNEFFLFQFEVLLFVFVIILSDCYMVATLTVGIVVGVLQIFVENLSKKNISKKALIDKRFLV